MGAPLSVSSVPWSVIGKHEESEAAGIEVESLSNIWGQRDYTEPVLCTQKAKQKQNQLVFTSYIFLIT